MCAYYLVLNTTSFKSGKYCSDCAKHPSSFRNRKTHNKSECIFRYKSDKYCSYCANHPTLWRNKNTHTTNKCHFKIVVVTSCSICANHPTRWRNKNTHTTNKCHFKYCSICEVLFPKHTRNHNTRDCRYQSM